MFKKSISYLSILLTVAFLVTITSCDPTKKKEKEEEDIIASYIAGNPSLQFEKKPSGLYYYEVQAGQGAQAITGDTAFVKYTGKFLSGTIFDSNVGETDTLKFPVKQGFVLEGFDEGISYMREGSKAILLIPSYLAYGQSGYLMPSYTPVLFDVELVKLKPGAKK